VGDGKRGRRGIGKKLNSKRFLRDEYKGRTDLRQEGERGPRNNKRRGD